MVRNFVNSIYVTIWTGKVDKILSYDNEKLQFTVQDVISGVIRTHMTSADNICLQNK